MAVFSHGRRSTGDSFRFGPQGPCPLGDGDFRDHDGKPKVIINPSSMRVRTPAAIEPLLTVEAFERLQAVLDGRAGTQRGKPRSRHPRLNPLGGRVFDADCGRLMYRSNNHGGIEYGCGLYAQSNGARCRSNHIDGVVAVRLVVSCIRQKVLGPDLLPRLEARLREIAAGEAESEPRAGGLEKLQARSAELEEQLRTVGRNMAMAATADQRHITADVFAELRCERDALRIRIGQAERSRPTKADPAAEMTEAMAVAQRLAEAAAEPENFEAAGELFRSLNAKLFLRFADVQHGRRVLRKPAGGVVTFGGTAADKLILRPD